MSALCFTVSHCKITLQDLIFRAFLKCINTIIHDATHHKFVNVFCCLSNNVSSYMYRYLKHSVLKHMLNIITLRGAIYHQCSGK